MWKNLLKYNDVALAVGVVLIVALMLIPLPTIVLDLLLTLNMALSITMLLVTVYTREALQFSTFPTVLLMATLFRLGLNVSSTRLILLEAEAGQVIHAFGNFVIGGNYVVGLLIFIILIIINFIVITNGAGRVAEVSARFTLDAMPGKQLSIDADLNAGLISNEDAKRRRQNIQKEADFYGTMDGASKFVKGDAIAAIIITLVNIIGGLIIGVLQHGMSIQDAAATYTILTVGEGLVAQIPALVISAATGILVTRVSDDTTTLGDSIGLELFGNPKIPAIMGGLIGAMGLIPGLPNLPFLLIGGGGIGLSVFLARQAKAKITLKTQQDQIEAAKAKKLTTTDNVMQLLKVETLELEIGYRLVPLIEAESGGDLIARIAQIRKQMATELGMVLPSVRVRDNLQLPPNSYHVKLRGVVIDKGEVYTDLWLAMCTDPDGVEPVDGIDTKEPAFGLPAVWVTADQKETAEVNGYTVVSPSAVISTHLSELIKRHSAAILSRQDVQELIDNLKKTAEPLVTDVIPDPLNIPQIQLILQNLLKERISIRDLTSIFESLGYHSRVSKDPDYLTEQCRLALSRSICKQLISPDTGELPVITLAPELEDRLLHCLAEDGKSMVIGPVVTQNLIAALNREMERIITTSGQQPVLLCHSRIRLPFRRFIERSLPLISVLSYNEIGPNTRIQPLGTVQIELTAQLT
jgi:flagellar biosynthesis protein FlhA